LVALNAIWRRTFWSSTHDLMDTLTKIGEFLARVFFFKNLKKIAKRIN